MERVPQIEPISKMKHQYNDVLRLAESGPVVLTQHGRAAAVVIHPAGWNAVIEEREQLLDIVAALKAELALAKGETQWEEIDPSSFIAEITDEEV